MRALVTQQKLLVRMYLAVTLFLLLKQQDNNFST